MIINEFFLDNKPYSKASLQERIASDIVAYKANWIFYDTVIDILVAKHPDFDKRDESIKLQIYEMKAGRDTSFEGEYRLKRLYESEYGTLDSFKDMLNDLAQQYADVALKAYGWKEKEENTND